MYKDLYKNNSHDFCWGYHILKKNGFITRIEPLIIFKIGTKLKIYINN